MRGINGFWLAVCLAAWIAAPLEAQFYTDDFERPDGAVDGWTVNEGNWALEAGKLVGGPPSGTEQEIYAGSPPLVLPDTYRLMVDVNWLAPNPPGGVGRHGGVLFSTVNVAGRGALSGYSLWWIDRAGDRGFNLARRDGGALTILAAGPGPAAPAAEPPSVWTIEVTAERIRVYGDGVLMIDVRDDTYRGGHFAVWTWSGEGQVVEFDDVKVEGIVGWDDFARTGIAGWTSDAGKWELVGGKLVSGPATGGGAAGEHQIFAGSPPVELPETYAVEFDWNWLAPSEGLAVGRHGGLLLAFNQPGVRWSAATSGYQVHWIDRASDHGLNLLRWDGAAPVALQAGTGDQFAGPPMTIRVEVDPTHIRVYGDGDLAIDIEDATYRGGIVGPWSWDGDGNHIEWDNFTIEDGDGNIIYEDVFDDRPPPLGDWTVNAGTWTIQDVDGDSALVGGPSAGGGQAGEQQVFIGSPPTVLPGDSTITFDWNILAPDAATPPIGRHAGVFIHWNQPGIRWAAETTGYQVHWIDRAGDRGLNLLRWDGAGIVALQAGTGDLFAEPPMTIRIETEGDNIRVYGDDVLAIDVVDGTYRGGLFGLWTWDGAGQTVAFDNISIIGTPVLLKPCIAVSDGPYVEGIPITFDAGCSFGDAETYTWDFGDGEMAEGSIVDHTFLAGDIYTVTLTLALGGREESTTLELPVGSVVLDYSEDFEQPDGDVEGWTIATGGWSVAGGELVTGPTTAENWIWAGDPPVVAPPEVVFEFDYEFLAPGSIAGVGRHGGFQFHCNEPTTRGQFSGYFIDWIDRPQDHGVRLTRVDNGAFAELVLGQPATAPADPPTHFRVVVEGARIKVYTDGADEPVIDIVETTYRGGYFGFWTYAGAQEVAIDNLTAMGDPLAACFTSDPALVFVGDTVAFDASCSGVYANLGTIESYEWDFGDGESAEGTMVEHAFNAEGPVTVTLTVTDDRGESATTSSTITVSEELVPFADCFDRPPARLDGWTVPLGTWTISGNGRASTATTATAPDGESWAWAGDPARPTGTGDITIAFDVPSALFLGAPGDAVGRHFGVMFHSNRVTTNRFAADSSGYVVWWIDRESDHGVNIARFDGAALTILGRGGEDLENPPVSWRIEVDGLAIRVYGDDELLIDVEDDMYRSGYFGFWTWENMSVQIDNVKIGTTGEPLPECTVPGGQQLPGDCNQDGSFDISDSICIFGFLFLGQPQNLPCGDGSAAGEGNVPLLDHNGDGRIDISDGIAQLQYLFTEEGAPHPLGEACTPIVGCPDVCVD